MTTFADIVARIKDTWETVIIAETQDGSGMKVWLEAMNHDSENPLNRKYRVRYGEENANNVVFESACFKDVIEMFGNYVKDEIMGYFGIYEIA